MQDGNKEKIQVLNYCSQAMEDLSDMRRSIARQAPNSADAIGKIISLLEMSVKFILPNCCNLVDPADLKQSHLDLARLPFPCVAFEAPWNKDQPCPEMIGDFKQTPATKRIALCWEPGDIFEVLPGMNREVLEAFPKGGIFLLPIYWGPELRKWTVALGGAFLPYGQQLRPVGNMTQLPATQIAYAAKIASGLANSKSKEFRCEPFYVLPEFFTQAEKIYGNREKAFAQIILDSHDETMLLIQACSVINCQNVSTVSIDPPATLNKKRALRGKLPLFTYKVLQLTDDRSYIHKSEGKGNHSSPRMHLRRGHLRRLSDKTIWVRPAMINAEATDGIVSKDYGVSKATK